MNIWLVRILDGDGVYHPHKRWLVQVPKKPVGVSAWEYAVRKVKQYFDSEDDPLEGGPHKWLLDAEIVEFEHGNEVATI